MALSQAFGSNLSMKRPFSLLICLGLPALVLLIGVIASVVFFFAAMPEAYRDMERVVVPPKATVQLGEPGQYSLWLYKDAVHEGQEYRLAGADDLETLPSGVRLMVTLVSSGERLPVGDWVTGEKNFGNEAAFLAGTFQVQAAQESVTIAIDGLDSPVVLGVSEMSVVDSFRVVLMGLAIFAVIALIAITLLIILLTCRKKQLLALAAE